MKTRHLLLTLALVIAAGLAAFGDRTPDGGIAEPVARVVKLTGMSRSLPSPSSPVRPNQPAEVASTILALQARADLFGAADQARPRSVRGSLFASQNWQPPLAAAQASRKMPPAAPPLPFIYLGKKIEDGVCEVYLGRGEQSLIVREKTVIDGTWRVDSIKPPTLTLTYLPLNQVQLLIIGGTD